MNLVQNADQRYSNYAIRIYVFLKRQFEVRCENFCRLIYHYFVRIKNFQSLLSVRKKVLVGTYFNSCTVHLCYSYNVQQMRN